MPNTVDFGLAVLSSVVLQDNEYRPTDVDILKSFHLLQHSHKSSYHRQSSLTRSPYSLEKPVISVYLIKLPPTQLVQSVVHPLSVWCSDAT